MLLLVFLGGYSFARALDYHGRDERGFTLLWILVSIACAVTVAIGVDGGSQ